ncbi:hypothetical protein [Yoonia sp. BS5-3]|uniref:Uncharacterized protein n=1 Tax=Yoonia phaeophyticola TaxID=3137369 RepID=A0ABZ2V0Y8_9RHOB
MSRTFLRNIAVIAALCAPATVWADTYFENGHTLEASDMLDLGLITSDGAGQVEVYDFHTGEIGALLGTENIHEGANTDVRVSTGLPVRRDVLVVVRVDGQVLAEKAFEVN